MHKTINLNTRTFFLLIFFFLSPAAIHAQQNNSTDSVDKPSAPITSDGCTMWFDGDFKDCCYRHDFDYRTGGSSNWRKRLRADNRLFLCVARKEGVWHLALAPVMWAGVRIFGSSLSPSSGNNVVHKFFKRVFITVTENKLSRQ